MTGRDKYDLMIRNGLGPWLRDRGFKSHVTWTGFAQPHRQTRDYSGFGPSIFERSPYEHVA